MTKATQQSEEDKQIKQQLYEYVQVGVDSDEQLNFNKNQMVMQLAEILQAHEPDKVARVIENDDNLRRREQMEFSEKIIDPAMTFAEYAKAHGGNIQSLRTVPENIENDQEVRKQHKQNAINCGLSEKTATDLVDYHVAYSENMNNEREYNKVIYLYENEKNISRAMHNDIINKVNADPDLNTGIDNKSLFMIYRQ